MFKDTGEPLQRAARQRQHVHRRGLGAHRGDPGAARRRAHRAADPGGPGREHPGASPATWPRSPSRSRTATPTCARRCRTRRPPPARWTGCCSDLEPTLPVLLANATSVSQVGLSHLAGLEQLLVVFPRVIAGGFTGTAGRRLRPRQPAVRQQRAAVHQGLPAASRVAAAERPLRRPDLPGPVHRRPAVRPARHAVLARRAGRHARARPTAAAYDPTSGIIDGVVDANGNPVRLGDQGNLSVLGGDSWKWLLVGPVVTVSVTE